MVVIYLRCTIDLAGFACMILTLAFILSCLDGAAAIRAGCDLQLHVKEEPKGLNRLSAFTMKTLSLVFLCDKHALIQTSQTLHGFY